MTTQPGAGFSITEPGTMNLIPAHSAPIPLCRAWATGSSQPLTDTIPFTGKPAPDGVDYVTELAPGWHIIAPPWSNATVYLGNIEVTDGVNTYPITSTENGLTQQFLWDYTGNGAYSGYEMRRCWLSPPKRYGLFYQCAERQGRQIGLYLSVRVWEMTLHSTPLPARSRLSKPTKHRRLRPGHRPSRISRPTEWTVRYRLQRETLSPLPLSWIPAPGSAGTPTGGWPRIPRSIHRETGIPMSIQMGGAPAFMRAFRHPFLKSFPLFPY